MPRIRTKKQFYRLWSAGLLGNRLRCWDSAAALGRAGFGGRVAVRSSVAGGPCRYGLTVPEALEAGKGWPCKPYFNEMAPDDNLRLQGEVAREVGGLCLTYSTTPGLRMREALKTAKTARGVAAHAILGAYLWPASRDDLDALWDLYPDSVIEFSAYGCAVGDQRNRNTLIWEVRDY